MTGFVNQFSRVANSGGTSTTLTLPSAVPAGDTLIASVALQKSASTMRYIHAIDSRHNKWRFVRSVRTGVVDSSTLLMYCYVESTLNIGDTVTFSFNGVNADRIAISVAQFNDPLTADVGAANDGGGVNTTVLNTPATATTADANELVFGAFSLISSSRIFTATNGFTGLNKVQTTNGSSDRAIVPEYKYVSSIGTYTANGTLDLGSEYSGLVQTFRLVAPPDTRTGRPKSWNGAAWVPHDAKAWNGSAWSRHRAKGMRIANWIGPYGTGGETTIYDDFDAIPVGEAADPGNTRFNPLYAVAPATATGVSGLHGTALRFNTDATSAHTEGTLDLGTPMQHVCVRFYIRPGTFPPSNLPIVTIQNTGSTALANFQLSTTGKLRVRNGNTLTATSTTTLTQNQWTRIEWTYNGQAGLQHVRIFAGANVEGTTADETISNQGAVVDRAASIVVGIITSTPSVTIDFDDFAVDTDKWVDSK